ncbi:MAG: rod shape-determining protein MreC [Candidatus Margulisiibacteriota bacterium]
MTSYRPFKRKNSYSLAITVVLLALAVSYFSWLNLAGLRSLLTTVITPFQLATTVVWRGVTGAPGFVFSLGSQASENAALKSENNALAAKAATLVELAKENERLRQALDFRGGPRYGGRLVAARVIARSGSPWLSSIEIDKGAGSGVKPDCPVVVREGLVGRVVEVAPSSARVLLLTDAQSSVAGADQRSRDFGIVEGYSPDTLFLRYVSSGADVGVGDQIVTAAISSLFPPGIPIGTVSAATKAEADLFYEIKIKPAVNFSRLEEVFLVQ